MARTRDDASRFLPEDRSLAKLAEAAKDCTACDLHKSGTQTVFGEGPGDAVVLFVGEQPGDAEDLAGRPFVGPAGKLLDRALAEAGIDRRRVYVTNAVKHFKWAPRGKRRLHAKPNASEIRACHPWLQAEIAAEKYWFRSSSTTKGKAVADHGPSLGRSRRSEVAEPLAGVQA